MNRYKEAQRSVQAEDTDSKLKYMEIIFHISSDRVARLF